MNYLKDFQKRFLKSDYHDFLKLWEEYCHLETPDPEELIKILQESKTSNLREKFGNHVDRALSLWKLIKDQNKKDFILKLILDIQTTNTEELADLAFSHLKKKSSTDKYFNEKIRLIGLRAKKNFTGAISKYELLTHLNKGKFIFHTAGWGTGEVLDISIIREEMSLEFEYIVGPKHLTFKKALNTMIPLPDDHFLSLRFGNPDLLEEKGKKEPLHLIILLLRDLGPKTALEIKDELFDLVIPEDSWNKWWQSAKGKIKKSTKIEKPKDPKGSFKLRKEEISHEETLYRALEKKPDINKTIELVFSFLKDFPEVLKKEDFKGVLNSKIKDLLSCEDIKEAQKLQLLFLLDNLGNEKKLLEEIKEIIIQKTDYTDLLKEMKITSFKKKIFIVIKEFKSSWGDIFLENLFFVKQNFLRDYLFSELEREKKENLENKLKELLMSPNNFPEAYVWYFQKIIKKKDQKALVNFFEGFMILLGYLHNKLSYRDLLKKMINILTNNRYEIVRDFMKTATLLEVKEFLLLSTKCREFTDHEIKIMHSLAEVAYPSLAKKEKEEEDILWATKEGIEKIKKRMEKISSFEIIKNSKEIEEARALGDLRENAEFKAALEKRSHLQSELKSLADQMAKVRVLTKNDVDIEKAGVGTIIECENKEGKKFIITILGPFESDIEKNIFSYKSKLFQKIRDLKKGEEFKFQSDELIIKKISNFFK